jgi:hypothetical protein
MFHAFIVVCAASINFDVDPNRCLRLNDAWGPYKTEENCNIRASQMTDDVLYGQLNQPIFYMMGQPPAIQAEGYCEKLDDGHDI